MQKIKVTFKRQIGEALQHCIEQLIITGATTNDDKLVLANLAEIAAMLNDKLNPYKTIQPSYNIKLSVAQALALCILNDDYGIAVTSHLGAALLTITNNIKQLTV